MKVIIAGTRNLQIIVEAIDIGVKDFFPDLTCVVSGCGGNVDKCGELWANINIIPVILCPVHKKQWDKYGKAAGPMRNSLMAEIADAALIFWNGKSPGSKNMAVEMKKRGKPYKVITV